MLSRSRVFLRCFTDASMLCSSVHFIHFISHSGSPRASKQRDRDARGVNRLTREQELYDAAAAGWAEQRDRISESPERESDRARAGIDTTRYK